MMFSLLHFNYKLETCCADLKKYDKASGEIVILSCPGTESARICGLRNMSSSFKKWVSGTLFRSFSSFLSL